MNCCWVILAWNRISICFEKNLTNHTFVHAEEAVSTAFAVVERLPTRYVACCTFRDMFKSCVIAQTKADMFLVKKDKKSS